MTQTAVVLLCGDCGPTHGPAEGVAVESYTEFVRPLLENAQMRFVNCMRTYSDRGVRTDYAPQVGQPIEMAAIFTSGLFDAVTMANNHSYDSGPEAMLDTRRLFISRGVQVTGAGRNLTEAREAAIVERNGVRVAYLGYTSVGREGSEAGPSKPGIAPVRVTTSYEHRGPHAPVRIRTAPVAEDLAMLVEDIAALRRKVDVVILAFHSGVIRLPRVIADYQVTVGHAAIDAGADLVVCHAPHIPKAIETYKGKAIFYSLGVFAMTKSFPAPTWSEPAWMHGAIRNHVDLDPEFPLMPYGKPSTFGLIARTVASREGIQRVSFLPVAMDKRYRPEVLKPHDARFAQVVEYLEWASEDMPHRFVVDNDEVVVAGLET